MTETIIIVDLEATCCDQGTVPRDEMEIIEIGAVATEIRTGEAISEFQSFVRPVRNPLLTDFCRELTTIRQKDVDAADGYPDVISRFSDWLKQWPGHQFGSWGDYDRRQFEKDSAFHDMDLPFPGKHRNIKREVATELKLRKPMGVAGTLAKLGMKFDGVAHRGIDDARNIAFLYKSVLCA